jgi:predicted  nucleic acid-binding Zn-ribbon protein
MPKGFTQAYPLVRLELDKINFVKSKIRLWTHCKNISKGQRDSRTYSKRLKDENTRLLVQLGEKDEEIDRLKDEVSSQEEIEGDLRTHLEKAKGVEEVLKDQLDEKDKACQKPEMEVVELRKKAKQLEAHVKMRTSILDEILECQRSPFDKTGLGYSKTMKETEEGSSCSIVSPSVPT